MSVIFPRFIWLSTKHNSFPFSFMHSFYHYEYIFSIIPFHSIHNIVLGKRQLLDISGRKNFYVKMPLGNEKHRQEGGKYFSKNKIKSTFLLGYQFQRGFNREFLYTCWNILPNLDCKIDNTYSLPTKSKVNRNCCFLVQRPPSCSMPFMSNTGRRAGALRQHESKTKAAAWLLGHHTNKISQRGRRHCHRRISYSEKAEMLLCNLGRDRLFWKLHQDWTGVKHQKVTYQYSPPSYNHTN